MARTIENTQLGLYFYVGPPALVEDYSATSAIHHKAAELIDTGLRKLPEWHQLLDDNGFPSTCKETGYEYPRAEMCEPDGELKLVDGRAAHSLFFQSSGAFPLDLAIALRDHCLAQYQKAAGGLAVEFAEARRYIRWSESEETVWAEV